MTGDNLEGPRLLLPDHHRRIEEACARLLDRSYADDSLALVAEFRRFERAILEHMQAEEDELLPGFAAAHPDDAEALAAAHRAIRARLDQVGLEVELHLVRAAWVEEMIARLRTHAAIEDTLLYPWARVHLPLASRRRLFARIGRSMRALAGQPRHAPPVTPSAELR